MSNGEKGLQAGEIVQVIIPKAIHQDKKIQRHRDIAKQNHIKRLLILSHYRKYYQGVPLGCKPRENAITIRAEIEEKYVYTAPIISLDEEVLYQIPYAQLKNRDLVLAAINAKNKTEIETQKKQSEQKTKTEKKQEHKEVEREPKSAKESSNEQKAAEIVLQVQTLYGASLGKTYSKKGSVTCPKCKKCLPTSNQNVFVPGYGFPTLRIGMCTTCDCYYSFSNKVYENPGEFNGKKVLWSALHYWLGKDDSITFKKTKNSKKSTSINTPVSTRNVDTAPAQAKQNRAEALSTNYEYDGLIKQLPVIGVHDRYCPICHRNPDGVAKVQYAIYDDKLGEQKYYTHAHKCTVCNIVFFDTAQEQEVRRRAGQAHVYTLKANDYEDSTALMHAAEQDPPATLPRQKSPKLPFDFDETVISNISKESKVILVYAKKCHCYGCQKKYGVNTIRNRAAIVDTLSGKSVQVNTMFCIGCGRYFMNYTSFSQYSKHYGGFLLEFRFTLELQDKVGNYMNFAADSVLSRCGYRVREGFPKEHRRAILQYILDTGKASKKQIVELLSGFISLRSRNTSFDGACDRWKEDIYFVNQYRIDEQKKVYGLRFQQGK